MKQRVGMGTLAGLLAQYQVDILFPAFHPPEGLSVSNALWLVMLGKVALLAFVTVLEKLPDGADPRWPHTLACRLAGVAAAAGVLGVAGAFWPYLEGLNTLRNAGYLLFLTWCGITGTIHLKIKL